MEVLQRSAAERNLDLLKKGLPAICSAGATEVVPLAVESWVAARR
jgi:hypothetical protein